MPQPEPGPDPEMLPAEREALAFLLPLSEDYPGIERWFTGKVVPGLRAGTRTLLRTERHGILVGLAIGKREQGERKICTVRVAPSHVGRGAGVRMIDGLLRWLDEDKPHFTISEGRLPEFGRIVERYGFDMTARRRGLYLPHVTEAGFNGALSEEAGTGT